MSAMPRRTTRSRCERRIDVCMREAPSYGTRWRRRTSKWTSSQTTVTPSIFIHGRAVVVCQSCGLERMRLLSVSRRWTFLPR
jgi:hypothetical protein